MKVVLVSPWVHPFHGYGGMQEYVFCLGKALQNKGVDVEIVTSSIGNSTLSKEVYKNLNYTLLPRTVGTAFRENLLDSPYTDKPRSFLLFLLQINGIPLVNFLQHLIYYYQVKKYLGNSTDFDIVHAFKASAFLYLFSTNRKKVITQPLNNEEIKQGKGLRNVPVFKVFSHCVRRSDSIASCGEDESGEIRTLYNLESNKTFHLPLGINLLEIEKSIEDFKITRSELGLSADDFVMITVNRLVAIKGVDYIVEALGILRPKLKNTRLIIIGAGPEENNINNLIKKQHLESSVIHLKNVEEHDMYGYLSLANVYINATSIETCTLGAYKAMACGLPVISTSGQEGAIVDGVNGFVVGKQSSTGIAEAVLKLHQKGYRQMGQESRRIVQTYDWNQVASKALDEYKKLLRQG